jgi:hypothetical protein
LIVAINAALFIYKRVSTTKTEVKQTNKSPKEKSDTLKESEHQHTRTELLSP